MSDHGRFGSGLVADWSGEEPGAPVFDAIHRSLLIRFPGAAEAIAAELAAGRQIVISKPGCCRGVPTTS